MIAPVDTVFVHVAGNSAWAEPATWIGLVGVVAGPIVAWLIGRQQIKVGKDQIASQLQAAEEQIAASRATAVQQVDAQLAAAREQIAAQQQITERQINAQVRATSRLKWIDDLRSAVANYVALVSEMANTLEAARSHGTIRSTLESREFLDLHARVLALRHAIRMWLNLAKPEQVAVEKAVNDVWMLFGTEAEAADSDAFNSKIQDIVRLTKVMLEMHWERAKRGE